MLAAQSQPIPIASSSKVEHCDTLLTPRTAFFYTGSPLTLRAASFGRGGMFPSCSPMHSFGVETPDFNFKGSLSSSIESEHDLLIKALNGDVASMQDDMCRNYTCCGIALNDLHALVEHFEDAHVVVLEPNSFPGANIAPFTADVPGGAFDVDDMELDSPPATELEFPSSQIPECGPTAAFETTSILVRRGGLSSSHAPYSPYQLSPAASRRSSQESPVPFRHSDYSSLSGALDSPTCVPPALLFSPSTTPSPLNTPAASRGTSPDHTSGSSVSTPSTPTAPGTAQPSLISKPFKCPKEGCNKMYKQANGLKYHITHGQCNFAPRDPSIDGLSDQEVEKKLKPYTCQVGCQKRFKNMSGLRYHYMHSAEHGRIGLALLQAGQMPIID